jgi:HEAT repeat protein
VRAAAARDLAHHVDSPVRSKVVAALHELAANDTDTEVRVQAILALADAGARESVQLLLELARTACPRVQQNSLLALSELGAPDDPTAVEVAVQAVASTLPALRYQGLVLLRNLRGSEGLAAIAERLNDEDPEVRWVAVRLIDELLPAGLREPPSLANGFPIGFEVIDRLRTMLQDPTPRVATAATLTLARLGEPQAVDRVAGMLDGKGIQLDAQDEQAVIELIGRRRLRTAQRALERIAWPRLWEKANT